MKKMLKREDIITKGNGNANDYFYHGNGGEYFLMASLSRRKYDAFKLPVDYGFDVLAMDPLNAGKRTHEPVMPYYFQVKTVYVNDLNPVQVTNKNSTRTVVRIPVKLKKDTLVLMENDVNKALIVYVYDQNRTHSGMEPDDCPTFYFWINGAGISEYKDMFVQEKRDDYVICWVNIVYPENPDLLTDKDSRQNTYVAFGTDFLTSEDGNHSINNAAKNTSWKMYRSLADQDGRYFKLSGFFAEAGRKQQ
ncbi:MAG: hypothetical protein K6F23_13190 [Solobacterium sp.]|nr:hypothetical protein [Solobacterium sp.]